MDSPSIIGLLTMTVTFGKNKETIYIKHQSETNHLAQMVLFCILAVPDYVTITIFALNAREGG